MALPARNRGPLAGVLRYAVPLVLCALFVVLAIRETGRTSRLAAASSVPKGTKIAFTAAGVENRLLGGGYTLTDGTLLSPAGIRASLAFTEENGSLTGVTLTLLSETAGRELPNGRLGALEKEARDLEKALVTDVFDALREASAANGSPSTSEREKALPALYACLEEGKAGHASVNGYALSCSLSPARQSSAFLLEFTKK